MPHTWDPDRYLAFADERGRPFVDLLARVGATAPRSVVDLGCGPGNLTALLADRWPAADVVGLDSSPEMVEQARAIGERVAFQVGDLRDWSPVSTSSTTGGPSSTTGGGGSVEGARGASGAGAAPTAPRRHRRCWSRWCWPA